MSNQEIRYNPITAFERSFAEVQERLVCLLQGHCLCGLPIEDVEARIKAEVAGHNNDGRALTWLRTPHPLLGAVSPEQAILEGRLAEVVATIKQTWPHNQ